MSNMGYCRFQNTYADLMDCNDYIFDDDLSESEKRYRKWLIKLCKQIVEDAGEYIEENEDDNNS